MGVFNSFDAFSVLLKQFPRIQNGLHTYSGIDQAYIFKLFVKDLRPLYIKLGIDEVHSSPRETITSFREALNLAILKQRREIVAREKEIGQGYW